MLWRAAIGIAAVALTACGRPPDSLTFSGSVLGAEGEIVRRQVARFEAEHGVRIEVRPTPDAADQRHQLYVLWLNAWSTDPDILQLDVIWTPEFAAAGWIRPLDEFRIREETLADFFDATLRANRWGGRLYAVPWFVDAGMLYWRTDLMNRAPMTFTELKAAASRALEAGDVTAGFVWQGARYEGLVTVFLEHLAGLGQFPPAPGRGPYTVGPYQPLRNRHPIVALRDVMRAAPDEPIAVALPRLEAIS